MDRMKLVFVLWLPVIFWCSLLFYLSSIPSLKAAQNPVHDEIIRSGAHFVLYALGYFLFFRALNFQKKKKNFWLPLILASLYGLSDEIHQLFVPTRTFQIRDLVIDFCGVVFGGWLIWQWLLRRT